MSSSNALQQLSPLRNTTEKKSAIDLAKEQAEYFGIDPNSEYGETLIDLVTNLYEVNVAAHTLWDMTIDRLNSLDKKDKIAWFNAKRFVSFQLAKILDTMQNPSRALYQSISTHLPGNSSKGAYPVFDNVTALFSANPVITRTATYMFACTEWVEDAFTGREPLHEIYSRLLNPTSISLANHIVDIECGSDSNKYMAWNFNSGMAAIDGILSHLIGREDIVVASRNIYGGSYQLLHDWFAKRSNLDVAIEWVDAYDGESFAKALDMAAEKHKDRLDKGRKIYVYIESPCNPHGFVLDVAGISRATHEKGWVVIADTTVGTPFLQPVLKREDMMERPDFVIHSYTKDLAGSGSTIAGVVIGRNEDMFIPKGLSVDTTYPNGKERSVSWEETLFWNVYYIKGGFLDSEKAFEVLNGMKTYEMRVLQKAINTTTLAKIFDMHPDINVSCPVLQNSPNHNMLQLHMHLGLPAALFTIDVEGKNGRDGIPPSVYKQFIDLLEPAAGMQVSLGQTNTVALCPAMTTHSELSKEALLNAGISPTTTRIAVGLEDPRIFISHFQQASEISIDENHPGFSKGFPSANDIDEIYKSTYKDVHSRYLDSLPEYDKYLD